MRFLTFIRASEKYRDVLPPPALMEAMGVFVARLHAEGSLVETGGLLPSKVGALIRLTKGQLVVTDGPFAEAKEVIGGFAIYEAPSLTDAMRIATEFMELHRKYWPDFECESEIRQMAAPGEAC